MIAANPRLIRWIHVSTQPRHKKGDGSTYNVGNNALKKKQREDWRWMRIITSLDYWPNKTPKLKRYPL